MINKKEFDKFTKEMWKRLKKGEEKYGDKYKLANIKKEMEEELVDVANYALMLNLKTKKKK